MKFAIYIFVCLILALNSMAKTRVAVSTKELVTKKVQIFKNSNGWSIQLPAGWHVDAIEDADIYKSPYVTLSGGAGSILVHATKTNTSAEERAATSQRNALNPSETFRVTEKINGKSMSGVKFYVRELPNGPITGGAVWVLFSSCRDKDLAMEISFGPSPADLKRSIKSLLLPQKLRDVLNTFDCNQNDSK